MSNKILIAFIVFGLVFIFYASGRNVTEASAYRPAPSAELQNDRWDFIEKMVSVGVFQKVEQPGEIPHLWVGQTFYELGFDDKSKFTNIVWAYYNADFVTLYDSRTGKQVGSYSEIGLQLK